MAKYSSPSLILMYKDVYLLYLFIQEGWPDYLLSLHVVGRFTSPSTNIN